MNRLAALPLLALLGGCVTTGPGSVTGGECKIFQAPPYAVRGATQYDQDWIDPTIEGGIGGCKWKRPAPRPAGMDATKAAPAPKAAPHKRRFKIWPVKTAPVVNVPAPPPPAPAAIYEPPVRQPRDAIDELLSPSDVT